MTRTHASGGCLCGTVRFRFALPTLWCAHCHCSLCRRAHGAAFVTWVGVASDRFELTSGAESLVRYASTPAARRSFCGQCGSTLFFESTRWPGEVHIAVANVDDPLDREPAAHVYWSERAPWGDYCGRSLELIEPDQSS
jgi:hypothetical protein